MVKHSPTDIPAFDILPEKKRKRQPLDYMIDVATGKSWSELGRSYPKKEEN